MDCIICNIAGPMQNIANIYSEKIMEYFCVPTLNIFQAIVTIWFLYKVIFTCIIKGEVKFDSAIRDFILLVMISILISNLSMANDLLFNPIIRGLEDLLTSMLEVFNLEVDISDYENGILGMIDTNMKNILSLGYIVMNSYNPFQIIGGLLIVITYIIVGSISTIYIIEYIFTVFFITSISPLILIAAGFKSTQKIAVNVLLQFASAIITVFISSTTIMLMLQISNSLLSIPTDSGSSMLEIKKFTWSHNYISLLVLGLISIFYQIKVKTFVSSMFHGISQINISNYKLLNK